MAPYEATVYSFFFGLLHGILPDEHTWPITLSYALGSSTGRQGMKAGLYFSAAFTVQRAILAEVSYLALAPLLLNPGINGIVYIAVGVVMALAGVVVLRGRHYPHVHLLGHRHKVHKPSATGPSVKSGPQAPPVHWTLVHGFIAGFGVGGFALFVNTVAAPAMGSPWLAFLPGLAFGLGTMLMLVLIGGLFGRSLRRFGSLTPEQIKTVGAQVGARTLFFGGLFFAALGVAILLGLTAVVPDEYLGYLTVGVFLCFIVVPALVFTIRRVRRAGGALPGDPPTADDRDVRCSHCEGNETR
jgi:sulfite exporter TauE/SafE